MKSTIMSESKDHSSDDDPVSSLSQSASFVSSSQRQQQQEKGAANNHKSQGGNSGSRNSKSNGSGSSSGPISSLSQSGSDSNADRPTESREQSQEAELASQEQVPIQETKDKREPLVTQESGHRIPNTEKGEAATSASLKRTPEAVALISNSSAASGGARSLPAAPPLTRSALPVGTRLLSVSRSLSRLRKAPSKEQSQQQIQQDENIGSKRKDSYVPSRLASSNSSTVVTPAAASHWSCHSTLSTTQSFYQILGIPVRNTKQRLDLDEDSFYSKLSNASHSTFLERFGWYGIVSGVGGFWLSCATLIAFLTLLTLLSAQVTTSQQDRTGSNTASASFYSIMTSSGPPTPSLSVVVATRLHNRQATHAMTDQAVRQRVSDFSNLCQLAQCVQGVIGVDAEDAHLLRQVQHEIEASSTPIHILPITPWGRFVPALNALIGYAASLSSGTDANSNERRMPDSILFVSAETTATRETIHALMKHMVVVEPPREEYTMASLARLRSSKLTLSYPKSRLDNSTLVVGARLVGHEYHPQSSSLATSDDPQQRVKEEASSLAVPPHAAHPRAVDLNGRTTPWNTLALWNLRKLATTGFLLLSEGYLTASDTEPSYGVEEVVTIALLQQLLGPEHAVAKLVPVPGVSWDTDFDDDPERQAWHDTKMESKAARAERQMNIAQLQGIVHHY